MTEMYSMLSGVRDFPKHHGCLSQRVRWGRHGHLAWRSTLAIPTESTAHFRTMTAVPVQVMKLWPTGWFGSGHRQAACDPPRTSARTSWRSGASPASQRLPPSGSSRRDTAKARMAATAKQAGPALNPACTGSGPEEWWEARCTVPGKVAKEGGSFSTKAPADLDPDNDETCPSCVRELGVRLAPLGGERRSGGRVTTADVGRTVRARPEWSPACDSSSSQDAGLR